MIIVLLLVLLTTVILYLLKTKYDYWRKRGVSGPKPWFLIGNVGPAICMRKSLHDISSEIYNQYKQFPIVGFYKATSPALLIRDPELIKDITIKSFQHFHDNALYLDKKVDPIFARNPFFLRGEEWKIVRSQLTPGFTSGKMKWIYPLLEDISKQLVVFIEKEAISDEGYEARELCYRFTLNNVASCAFGLEGKCFEEENNEFRQIATDFLTPGSYNAIIFLLAIVIPAITDYINLRFVTKNIEDKLTAIIGETLQYREENNIVRNDFLHILQELKNSTTYKFTDIDVTAHAAGFFVDGYETSSATMSFLLYELASNPEIQKKLREEINQSFQENNGSLPYDVLQNLPYLDAALNESLRIRPPLPEMQKICTKAYTYVPKDGDGISKPVVIEKGTLIVVPLHGLHHDPKYFKDPEIYNPDRFVGANKENITKCTFLPFGEGPRACLGQRFGVLQVKVGVAYIIKNYELSINRKTKLPLTYNPLGFLAPIGGLWIDFKKL